MIRKHRFLASLIGRLKTRLQSLIARNRRLIRVQNLPAMQVSRHRVAIVWGRLVMVPVHAVVARPLSPIIRSAAAGLAGGDA
jgi:hypothetical protein